MSWNGFSNLDLSDVEVDDYAPLETGEHEVRSTDVEIKTLGSDNKRLIVTLSEVNGAGTIKAGFNIVHRASKQAQEIGLSQLKSFLVAGGHPNPDKPGDIMTLKGLTCRIYVGMGKPYTNKEGKQVQRAEVKRFIIDEDKRAAPPSGGGAWSRSVARDIDDEIPF